MRRTIGMLLAVLTLAGVAAADCEVPPKPPGFNGDKWAWERAYKRCMERPTEWARNRCVRGLYE